MPVLFKIEAIFKIADRGYYVFAKHLNTGQNFVVTDKSFLGGVELVKYLDIPRATNGNEKQRDDLFAFQIKNEEDNSRLLPQTIVELTPGETLHYLKPWYSFDSDLTIQLHREINKKHILFGRSVKTIARRQDNDDVLFEVDNADFRYAMVHLTWSQKISDNAEYPKTKTYKNWQDVYENRIIIDHIGWENE